VLVAISTRHQFTLSYNFACARRRFFFKPTEFKKYLVKNAQKLVTA
jgi:hypothetical protein